ncbi:FAD-dependent oxidoreductase [Salinibacterium sp. SWN167]|nr:FAD-dependent oxidoreductase [Salinibacterium sp. SWN167]
MARVVVMGAGVAGHTAALHLKRKLGKQHDVVVVSPNSQWNWIPSNIWVGVDRMAASKVVFPLAPIYRKKKIEFHQAKATTILPDGDAHDPRSQIEVEYTSPAASGSTARIPYDYLINATGPALNFAATPGLGPDTGHTVSVCTPSHAVHAAQELKAITARLKNGEKLTLVVGTGHGTCTCEGAAFEYVLNVEHELRRHGVRDNADIVFFTNEMELGDFGVGGMIIKDKGSFISGGALAGTLFAERGIRTVLGAAATAITADTIEYVQVDGAPQSLHFDFSMLLPPFRGVPFEVRDRDGRDITATVFAPSGFMKVDADYAPKAYEDWQASDWPKTYQSPAYPNMFAAGIAFAPPHAISEPHQTPDGVMIAPAPPRTGQPSGAIAKAVAFSIVDMIQSGAKTPTHTAPMNHLAAACVASAGTGAFEGSAVAMVMSPIIPDFTQYPETGRNITETTAEIGLGGHWAKRILHTAFMYKMHGYPFWWVVPE